MLTFRQICQCPMIMSCTYHIERKQHGDWQFSQRMQLTGLRKLKKQALHDQRRDLEDGAEELESMQLVIDETVAALNSKDLDQQMKGINAIYRLLDDFDYPVDMLRQLLPVLKHQLELALK